MTMAEMGNIVPDFLDLPRNRGELEGSGSSEDAHGCRDSGGCMKKSLSFNLDNRDGSVIPAQTLSLTNILPAERKDIVLRLRAELDQIHRLQKKLELGMSTAKVDVALSHDGKQEGIEIVNARRSDTLASNLDMKSKPLLNRSSSWTGSSSGKLDTGKMSRVPNKNAHLMDECRRLVRRLISHEFGWVFENPVDAVKLNIPDYFTIIKHPMDLGTIDKKILSSSYSSPLEFVDDVRLTFSNAMTYNPPGHDVNFMAKTLSKLFETRWKAIEKKLTLPNNVNASRTSAFHGKMGADKDALPPKRRKVATVESRVIMLTKQERENISRDLEDLLGELPSHIIDFLKEHSSGGDETGDDEIEIDIDALSDGTLRSLWKLLDDYLQEKQRKNVNPNHCKIEILNEPGPSNSSPHLAKVNHPDQDVDVGINAPPVTTCPIAFVETERGQGSCKVFENSEPVSGLDQVEMISHPNPNFTESDSPQHGESATSEKQLSPDKLYRVAMLRNRFADTILNAQEKRLDQGQRKDPEKLRKEREEFERQRRREKARLEAEARAAEDARRRKEAEAVAEAKRKRELEREAAREALRKMEKTVEINESCSLEDLEKLSAGGIDLNSLDERSPEECGGLPGFFFGGSNPLEQLGLFMKVDEEEEGDALNMEEVVNDVEEGEID